MVAWWGWEGVWTFSWVAVFSPEELLFSEHERRSRITVGSWLVKKDKPEMRIDSLSPLSSSSCGFGVYNMITGSTSSSLACFCRFAQWLCFGSMSQSLGLLGFIVHL